MQAHGRPTVIFDKVCAADKPFPWPAERISDTLVASTYLQSSGQPVSQDGAYEVNLSTKFVDPSVKRVSDSGRLARFTMALRDLNAVLPPFRARGYTVKCSRDRGVYAPCFDNGALSLPRVPRRHTLGVRVRVLASKLLPGEVYVVRIDGRKVASGKASLGGNVSKLVKILRKTKIGKVSVTVRGATASRSGKDTLRVVRE